MRLVSLRCQSPSSIIDTFIFIPRCRLHQGSAQRCMSSVSVSANQHSRRISSRTRRNMATPPLLQKQYMSSKPSPKKAPSEPRPSASILLISPSNQILLLHRVHTSRSFPSAHVFPGGNLSPRQDGDIPAPSDPKRHQDGPAYRLGAIRECFEESGILIARRNDGSGTLLQVPDNERERARKEIHPGRLRFADWVDSQGGIVDTESLIPFTRWITPTNIPKRFTTQMYIAFLDLPKSTSSPKNGDLNLPTTSEVIIPTPTSDGGVEHTAALFAPCSTWLAQARANEIILFPPQFYLMHLLAPFLSAPPPYQTLTTEQLQAQRDAVITFLQSSNSSSNSPSSVPWSHKVMSPSGLFMRKSDGRSVLALDKPGQELDGSGRSGDPERIVLVRFSKEGPRDVDVRWRKEALEEERAWKERERVEEVGGTKL